MDATRKILFALLQTGLQPDGPQIVENARRLFAGLTSAPDWPSVYRAAAAQGVLAVVWDGLQRLVDEGVVPEDMMPDRRLKVQWVYNVNAIEEKYRRQEKTVSRLARFYAEHGIDMMLLKGYGLSLCYPVPEHRPCGDVDIWLYGRQQEADDLIRQHGVKVAEDEHHHTVFTVNGVMVENHYDFLNVYAHISNRVLEARLQQYARESAESIEVGGERVQLPPAQFNALFLLRHAASHYAAENIGLRHVVDWAMFIMKYGSSVDWAELERISKEVNMHRFLYCLNGIAAECAGLSAELLPEYPRDGLEMRVLNDILNPEFDEKVPEKGVVRLLLFKFRRWWANRWKHRLVYREGLLKTFVVQIYSHLLKPKTLIYRK